LGVEIVLGASQQFHSRSQNSANSLSYIRVIVFYGF
jgi:hypothetical protein